MRARRMRLAAVLAVTVVVAGCGGQAEYYVEGSSPAPTATPPAELAFDAAAEVGVTSTPTPRLAGRPDPRTELILVLVRLGLTRAEASCIADAVDAAALQPGDMPATSAIAAAAADCGMDQGRLAQISRPNG